jgi:hypothetical protein
MSSMFMIASRTRKGHENGGQGLSNDRSRISSRNIKGASFALSKIIDFSDMLKISYKRRFSRKSSRMMACLTMHQEDLV